jgi:hypothetical protein
MCDLKMTPHAELQRKQGMNSKDSRRLSCILMELGVIINALLKPTN